MCHFCGWATCFIHKEQMHYGLTCEEYDSWKEASRALAALGYDADEEELTQALLRRRSFVFFSFFSFSFSFSFYLSCCLFLLFLFTSLNHSPIDAQNAKLFSQKRELFKKTKKMKLVII